MFVFKELLSSVLKLSVPLKHNLPVRNISSTNVNNIYTSSILCAEPLKKKKKIDPAVLKGREERKKKKLEKQIRRLEKNARQLKPIDECEIPLNIMDEIDTRRRITAQLTVEEVERRALLLKMWSKFKLNQHFEDIKMLDRVMFSQQRALDELKAESEELYLEAIQNDFFLIPLHIQGPVETPPIEKFDSLDGDYTDISKKWD